MKKILVIPGDGIGPEVMSQALKLLSSIGEQYGDHYNTTVVDWGAERWLRYGEGIPDGELEQIPQKYDAILFGALGDPRIPDMAHGREILLGLRTGLDLYINQRPVKLLDPSLSVLKNNPSIDFVIFRENTQDIYQAIGGSIARNTSNEVAIDESIHTYQGVKRIIEAAFSYAQISNRKRLCLVDKSNAIKHSGDLWQRLFKSVAKDYPNISTSHLYVDVAAMKLVQEPESFDVIVTTNLFGDILSDLGAGLVGGLGLAASANINPNTIALFEPVHGSAPDMAGKNIANPFAMFMTVAMMLEYLGHKKHAKQIELAITQCIKDKQTTIDLGGKLSSNQAAEVIIEILKVETPALS